MSDAYERPRKRGLIARLLRLTAGLGLLAALGLLAGYKLQHGQWAWDDPDGFLRYSKQTTRTNYGRLRSFVVRTNENYRLTERSRALYERARNELARLIEGEPGTKQPQSEAPSREAIEAQRESNFGFTDAEIEQLPPGYFEEYKAGLAAYREALQAFRASMPGAPDADARLREAKEHFEQARGHWEKAQAAWPEDGRVRQLLEEVQEYLHDINKRMTVG